jgi:sulfate permease, SulP family
MAKPDLSNLDPGTIIDTGPGAGVAATAPGFTALLPEPAAPTAAQYLKGDLAGGITSGVVALPQTITIGALAFAPLGAEYVTFGILAGFYCAIVSGALVAAFGGTRFGLGGPRSSFSLVIALIISALIAREIEAVGAGVALSEAGTARVLVVCFLCISLAGALQVVFGLMGVGAYIKFIPHPVVAGFMNGLAFLVLVSQMPVLLGLSRRIDWWDLRAVFNAMQPETTLVAVVTMVAIWRVNLRWPKFPGAIAGVVAGTAFYYFVQRYWPAAYMDLLDLGPVVGDIPAKFPAPVYAKEFFVAAFDTDTWMAVWLVAPSIAVLAILGALESLMCAVAVGQISGRRPEANKELVAQGASNIVGGMFGAVFGGSTGSRTLLNYRAGGRTRLSGFIHVAVMLLALMTAQYWVAFLPHVVLSAVLSYIAFTMFDGWTRQIVLRMRHRNVHREVTTNFAIVALVTIATVAFNLVAGVIAGFIATVIVFLGKSSKAVVRSIQRGDRRHSLKLRNSEKTAYLREHGARILLFELDGTLFFGTADQLALEVEQLAHKADFIIFDCRRVTEFDATGAHILEQIGARLTKQGKHAALSHVVASDAHGQFLAGMGLGASIPQDQWFSDSDYALEWCENQLLAREFADDETRFELPLDRLGIAQDCDATEIALLKQSLQRHEFNQGEYLFREGDAGDTLYVPVRGSISITLPIKGGGETKRLVTLSPGVMFGEMVLIETRPRSADAVADEYSVVYGLKRDVLDALRVEHPALAGKLLFNISRLLAERLRTTTEELRAAAA